MLKVLKDFVAHFKEREDKVNAWLQSKRDLVGYNPTYSSVDLRNGGFKVVPVDTNLFPAGWNNLCNNYAKEASEHFKNYFAKYFPNTKCLLILPEDHTRNLYYFSNLRRLQQILLDAGFTVKIGSLNPELGNSTTFLTAENEEIILHKIVREGDNLIVDDKKICQVLVNNDFSSGVPDILKGIKQNLLPTPEIGWHSRRKSEHFSFYNKLIDEFAEVVGIDSWHFNCHFSYVGDTDFDDENSRKIIAVATDELIAKIAVDYKAHNISEAPSVFIKNDAGTYGVAVIRVNSGEDVLKMNQKMRKQMRIGKGRAINSVILQEGVVTVDRIKGLVAEPVIYLVGNRVTGGFYRLNTEKGDIDNLNSRGMSFSKSCMHKEDIGYENIYDPTLKLNDIGQLYSVLATIASLAAGEEFKLIKK